MENVTDALFCVESGRGVFLQSVADAFSVLDFHFEQVGFPVGFGDKYQYALIADAALILADGVLQMFDVVEKCVVYGAASPWHIEKESLLRG